jgi:hypothetical protein
VSAFGMPAQDRSRRPRRQAAVDPSHQATVLLLDFREAFLRDRGQQHKVAQVDLGNTSPLQDRRKFLRFAEAVLDLLAALDRLDAPKWPPSPRCPRRSPLPCRWRVVDLCNKLLALAYRGVVQLANGKWSELADAHCACEHPHSVRRLPYLTIRNELRRGDAR